MSSTCVQQKAVKAARGFLSGAFAAYTAPVLLFVAET